MEVVEKLKSKKSRGKKWIKGILYTLFFLFLLVNFMAYMHARKFTNFKPGATGQATATGMSQKEVIKTLFLGIDVPRPENTVKPNIPFEEISLISENGKIAGWLLEPDSAIGTVIIAHGYKSCMSKMLPYGYAIRDMGYNALLFDSSGSGDSEGNHCTIGYKESKDLKTVFDYANQKIGGDIYVLGTSMGAAIALRAVAKDGIRPKAIIAQCPFATMQDASKGRFREMGVPYFGFGHLLLFWGSVQNGFNTFGHNPSEYAQSINVPTLLLWGAKDQRVTRAETDLIYSELSGKKELVIFENAGHSGVIISEPMKWKSSVRQFLNKY